MQFGKQWVALVVEEEILRRGEWKWWSSLTWYEWHTWVFDVFGLRCAYDRTGNALMQIKRRRLVPENPLAEKVSKCESKLMAILSSWSIINYWGQCQNESHAMDLLENFGWSGELMEDARRFDRISYRMENPYHLKTVWFLVNSTVVLRSGIFITTIQSCPMRI